MKHGVRKDIKARLAAMAYDEAVAKSAAACHNLLRQPEFASAKTVLMYLAMPSEVDTAAIALAAWQQDKVVLVPRMSWSHKHMTPVKIDSLDTGLVVGNHGIREPQPGQQPWPVDDIDLVVTPALAYDRKCQRLGRGGGFYDRFLSDPRMRAHTIGLAFDEQVVDELPTEGHDCPVDVLVTDKEIIRRVNAPADSPATDGR